MNDFTFHYKSMMKSIDYTNLPYWGRCAALRTVSRISHGDWMKAPKRTCEKNTSGLSCKHWRRCPIIEQQPYVQEFWIMPNLVFVYGTLRTGQSNYGIVADWVRSARPATIEGMLYHLPTYGFPAVVPGRGTVYGEVLEFTDFAKALAAMDDLEEYRGPGEDNFYERIVVCARLQDGSEVECYAYVFPVSRQNWLRSDAEYIPGGDWVEYINRRVNRTTLRPL
jgi:gamma-glutamylcyclotransferase (GGCT)/AIG2-like uncharacterized protein YtfP